MAVRKAIFSCKLVCKDEVAGSPEVTVRLTAQPRIVLVKYDRCRGVAQLVARTAGGREVAGSSPVTPTKEKNLTFVRFFSLGPGTRLALTTWYDTRWGDSLHDHGPAKS